MRWARRCERRERGAGKGRPAGVWRAFGWVCPFPLSTGFAMNVITSGAAIATTASLAPADRTSRPGKILFAGYQLLPFLERGQAIGAADLRSILTAASGGSDAEGFWAWKDAYEATEVGQVLFLRKFGTAICARANPPLATLA